MSEVNKSVQFAYPQNGVDAELSVWIRMCERRTRRDACCQVGRDSHDATCIRHDFCIAPDSSLTLGCVRERRSLVVMRAG